MLMAQIYERKFNIFVFIHLSIAAHGIHGYFGK